MLSALFVFGITAVSAPSDVLGASVLKAAACGANLRTSPYVSARLRTTIRTDTRVTVATSVTGGSWRVTCAGKTSSGKYWYRISAINGRIDAGNAYGFGTDFDPTNLRLGAGVGVRFFSPLGPLRLDLGYNIDREPGEKEYQVHFTVGSPF